MRNLFSVALSFILLFVITGCGQSGALMLPSDPNYDKRSNYILHKKVQPENLSNHNESDTSSPDTQQN